MTLRPISNFNIAGLFAVEYSGLFFYFVYFSYGKIYYYLQHNFDYVAVSIFFLQWLVTNITKETERDE